MANNKKPTSVDKEGKGEYENAKKIRLRPGLIRGPVHYKCTALPLSHKAA